MKDEQKQYQTQGIPLVPAAEILPFVYDGLGKDVIALANERFKGINCVELGVSNLRKNQPVSYSNLFRRYAWGSIARELTREPIRPITPAGSELGLKYGTLPGNPEEYWEDLGLALYQEAGPNEDLRQSLLEQAKARGLDIELPAIATSLAVVRDDKSNYGARFDLGELGIIYSAPILRQTTGNFEKSDNGLTETGLPAKLGRGTRTLYTASTGLRRFCRRRNLFLGANAGDVVLSNSYEAGRVNFIKFAEGEPQNLQRIVAQIEAERQRQVDLADKRAEQAMRVAKGELVIPD